MRLPGDADLNLAIGVWRRNLTVNRHTWVTNILRSSLEPILYLVGMGVGLGHSLRQGMAGSIAFRAARRSRGSRPSITPCA